MIIEGKDFDEVLYEASKALIHSPELSPRGFKTKELVLPHLVIEKPDLCVTTNPGRKLSVKYLDAEMAWYNSGSKSIEGIKDYSTMWERIANKNGEVNSNYGEIAFHQELPNFTGNQFQWVIDSLAKDKDSRQALINFNQPKHKKEGEKDFVCTIATHYLIRDDKLDSVTFMRSNDIIYGLCYDFPFFSSLQQNILQEVQKAHPEVTLGSNTHIPTSLHVYEKHYNMLENMVKHYEENEIKSRRL